MVTQYIHTGDQVDRNVRVFLDGKIIVPGTDGAIAVAAGPLLVNEITVNVPEGAKFVASVKGSRYYPIDSSRAEQIAPENRVYFRSEAEAEGAGYEKGS